MPETTVYRRHLLLPEALFDAALAAAAVRQVSMTAILQWTVAVGLTLAERGVPLVDPGPAGGPWRRFLLPLRRGDDARVAARADETGVPPAVLVRAAATVGLTVLADAVCHGCMAVASTPAGEIAFVTP